MFKALLLLGRGSTPHGYVTAWDGAYPGVQGAQQVGSCISCPALQL